MTYKQEITYEFVNPDQPEIIALIQSLDMFQEELYPPESNHFLDISALQDSSVYFMVVKRVNKVVGCGAVKIDPRGWGEIKRMYVEPEQRGKGLSKEMISRLEQKAVSLGIGLLRLETGIYSSEALRAYERMGYCRTGPFGDYKPDPLSVFMEKTIQSPPV